MATMLGKRTGAWDYHISLDDCVLLANSLLRRRAGFLGGQEGVVSTDQPRGWAGLGQTQKRASNTSWLACWNWDGWRGFVLRHVATRSKVVSHTITASRFIPLACVLFTQEHRYCFALVLPAFCLTRLLASDRIGVPTEPEMHVRTPLAPLNVDR